MSTDPHDDQIAWGLPTHLRAEGRHSYLTVCGVFTHGVKDRITDERGHSNCINCIGEGPASAWVVLPDGTRIDRRCTSIQAYQYAVAGWQTRKSDERWVLRFWAKDEDEARFLATELRYRSREIRLLPVQHAGSAARP